MHNVNISPSLLTEYLKKAVGETEIEYLFSLNWISLLSGFSPKEMENVKKLDIEKKIIAPIWNFFIFISTILFHIKIKRYNTKYNASCQFGALL
jgi:hypothetical protein